MREVGDKVRVDIPDKSDPDFEYHREQGTIVEVIDDDLGSTTGDERSSKIYRVELDTGDQIDFRWRDLRPSE